APGNPANPTGTLNVAGNLTFEPSAFYGVNVNGTANSFTHVTGTATLTGATVEVNVISAPVSKQTYTILTADGTRLGTTFAGLEINNPNFVRFLSYPNASDVVLTLEPQLGVGAPNLTQNQRNVDNAINSVLNSGGTLPPAFDALFGLTGANLTHAL